MEVKGTHEKHFFDDRQETIMRRDKYSYTVTKDGGLAYVPGNGKPRSRFAFRKSVFNLLTELRSSNGPYEITLSDK